ncbi:MAG: MFS transporter [Bacillota bacterium]
MHSVDTRADRAHAMRFIVLLGLVSLFADMTYEGARSATGPFLLSLGASAGVVGAVAGLGELLGYAIRLGSGYLTDRIRRYWLLTGIGYGVNLLAVPLLALAGNWQVAAGLVLLERIGKAVRTPSRDVMLSFATRQVGRGFGFGLHEMLDQIGAVAGPLLVAGALFTGEGYRRGFAVLLAPAMLALGVLAAARAIFPAPARFEQDENGAPAPRAGPLEGTAAHTAAAAVRARLGRPFWLYVAFTAVAVAGFAHFQLISYHIKARGLMDDPSIPLAFALAMGVDALTALVVGKLYDRIGMGALLALPAATIPATVLAFGGSPGAAWAGVALWGMVMGVQETIMRAAIADLAPPEVRGSAYGIFNTAFGGAWFLGSTAMGLLYEVSAAWVVTFSVTMQLLAVPLFAAVHRASPRPA